MNPYKRIFIVGHPGSGKVLFARKLAEKLDWQVIVADLGLETHLGRKLTNIIGKQGEEVLHHCQAELLSSFINQENIIVVTDASVVCDEKNSHLLSPEFVIYLKASTAVQIERTSRNPTPLLTGGLATLFEELHHERDRLYEQVASITINSDTGSLGKHIQSALKFILHEKKIKQDNQFLLDKDDLVFFHKHSHDPVHLSAQQAVYLKLLAQGKTSKEIAELMKLSYRTVENYLARTMELLGCISSKELIALYYDQP